MTRYTLVKLDKVISHYPCMVVATSYLDPLENMEQITLLEFDIKNNLVTGKVLFDLLACVGDNSERYLTLEFDGTNFDLNSCQFVQFSKESDVRQISMNVYQQLNEELYNTVLNSKQIDLLLHGIAI
ncbi:type II toxin-antitoxin system RnlB family antitoxin [Paenisporosarcina indica]|uniref:type II toxin-antitoxin system RnlB family antitoxin n=1 Tax=Paenisporosarcina indica TaxID=650093 RepID=UPI0009501749|nr:type II toxin-antitoxin system RnlB family antitoxin [Paenisporosarcina indica]